MANLADALKYYPKAKEKYESFLLSGETWLKEYKTLGDSNCQNSIGKAKGIISLASSTTDMLNNVLYDVDGGTPVINTHSESIYDCDGGYPIAMKGGNR